MNVKYEAQYNNEKNPFRCSLDVKFNVKKIHVFLKVSLWLVVANACNNYSLFLWRYWWWWVVCLSLREPLLWLNYKYSYFRDIIRTRFILIIQFFSETNWDDYFLNSSFTILNANVTFNDFSIGNLQLIDHHYVVVNNKLISRELVFFIQENS